MVGGVGGKLPPEDLAFMDLGGLEGLVKVSASTRFEARVLGGFVAAAVVAWLKHQL